MARTRRRTEDSAVHFEPVLCMLWVHDDSFSTEHVLFNPDALDKPELAPGAVIQVRETSPSRPDTHDFVVDQLSFPNEYPGREISIAPNSVSSFIFVSRQIELEVTTRNPKLQLSVSRKIADLFNFQKNSQVWVSLADPRLHTATHVELAFRDVYLTRADMQRMTISCLVDTAVHIGQPLTYAGAVRATIKAIYRNGRKIKSAMIRNTIKPIFRSESSTFILYIQMSREMWDFDKDGSGEICFNKVVHGLLPQLFTKWSDINARHMVSIVLFTRIEYDAPLGTENDLAKLDAASHDPSAATRDFYRVVVGQISSGEWADILRLLKKEFKTFLKEILLYTPQPDTENSREEMSTSIAGRPSSAENSNILEAINTAASPLSKDWIDTDLFRTGLSIVVITPGTGVFEVDEALLRLTTDNLVKNGINIDLVCLSRPPLHVSPLFRYLPAALSSDTAQSIPSSPAISRRPIYASTPPYVRPMPGIAPISPSTPEEVLNKWVCVVPQWAHIHFWQSPDDVFLNRESSKDTSLLRDNDVQVHCSMYDVQMTGIMESEMSSIAIPYLDQSPFLSNQNATAISNSEDPDSLAELSMQISHSPSDHFHSPEKYHKTQESIGQPNSRHKNAWEIFKAMGKYDGQLFAAQATVTVADARPSLLRHSSHGPRPHDRRESHLSSIFQDSLDGSIPENSPSSLTPPITHRLRMEQEKKRKAAPSLAVSGSITPTLSTITPPRAASITTVSSGGPRFDSRLLLGTNSGLAFGKGTASTIHSEEYGSRHNNPLDSLFSFSPATAGTTPSISHQVRSSLSRSSTAVGSPPTSSRAPSIKTAPRDVPKSDPQSIAWPALNASTTKPLHISDVNRSAPHQSTLSRVEEHRNTGLESRGNSGPVYSLPIDLAPWLTITNPARPDEAITYDHGWSHAFTLPSQGLALKMKWKSLCSPASLPLTSDYKIDQKLLEQYEERLHKVALEEFDDDPSIAISRARLLSELIAFRLSKGFQIIRNVSQLESTSGAQITIAYDDRPLLNDGCTITLVKGNQVHVLCATGSEIQITRYQPKSSSSDDYAEIPPYEPIIRSTLEATYKKKSTNLFKPGDNLNWSMIDNCLAGHFENFSEATGYWRAKFVLIPVPPPSNTRRIIKGASEDSDDELRIEGIQRLTQLWDRAKASTDGPQNLASANLRKDPLPNSLGLEFQTRDASAVLSAGLEDSRLVNGQSFVPSTQLFSDSELYRTDKIDLKKLAVDLQGEKGIDIKDRWWYLKLHHHVFVGAELTSWLLLNFKDVNTRGDAEQLGRKLIDLGLIKHVRHHTFRDGNYFYTLTNEYRSMPARPATSRGFFSRRQDKGPTPSTPLSRETPSRSSTLDKSPLSKATESPAEPPLPTQAGRDRRRIHLTAHLQLDLDSRHRSSRPELVNLHYDRLFNPESCYHFRLEWLHTTAKLIEEAVSSWSTTAERYGMKLVQVPISEGCKIAEENPFRTPSVVELSVPPPEMEPDLSHVDSAAPEPLPTHRYHPYQRALLKRFDFVLDEEASVNFPDDVDVRYSFNHTPYTFSQYIHKSGLVLAQVDIEGRLLLVANRLLTHQRREVAQRREEKDKSGGGGGNMFEKRASPAILGRPLSSNATLGGTSHSSNSQLASIGPPAGGARPFQFPASTLYSSIQSPLLIPHDLASLSNPSNQPISAEWLKEEIARFCSDEDTLYRFYDDVAQHDPVLSARSTPAMRARETPSVKGTPLLMATIPTLELPPIGGFEETWDGRDGENGRS